MKKAIEHIRLAVSHLEKANNDKELGPSREAIACLSQGLVRAALLASREALSLLEGWYDV